MEIADSYLKGWKTPCEREKLLVTSNFSLSHTVLKGLVQQSCKKKGLSGKDLKRTSGFNSLPKDKILYWTKLKKKKNCRRQNKFGWGKRRECWFPAFSPFPTMFSKDFFLNVVKINFVR